MYIHNQIDDVIVLNLKLNLSQETERKYWSCTKLDTQFPWMNECITVYTKFTKTKTNLHNKKHIIENKYIICLHKPLYAGTT